MKRIQYGVHRNGFVVSRIDSEVAWPVLDFAAIGKGGKDLDINTGEEYGEVYQVGCFRGPMRLPLEKADILSVVNELRDILWTRKIPLATKNYHRAFWGMKPLRSS